MNIHNIFNVHKYFNIVTFKFINFIKFNKLLALLVIMLSVSACGIYQSNYKAIDTSDGDVSDYEEFFGDSSTLSGIYNKDYNLFLTYLDKAESANEMSTYQFVTCSSEVLKEEIEYCALDDVESIENDNSLNRCPEQNILAKHCVPAFQGSLVVDQCSNFRGFQNFCSRAATFVQQNQTECRKIILDNDADVQKKRNCSSNMQIHQQCLIKLPSAEEECGSAVQYLELNCSDEDLADEKCQDLNFDPESRTRHELILPIMDPISKFGAGFHAKYERFLSRQQSKAAVFFNGVSNGSIVPMLFNKNFRSSINQFGQPILKKISKKPKWWLSGIFNSIKYTPLLYPKLIDMPIVVEHVGYAPLGSCLQSFNGMNLAPHALPPFEQNEDVNKTLANQALPTSLGFVSNLAIIRATSNHSPPVRFGSMIILPFVATMLSILNTDHSTDDVYNNLDSIFEYHESVPASNDLELTKLKVDMHKLLPLVGRSLVYLDRTHFPDMQRYCVPKLQDGEYVPECFPIYEGDEGFLYKLGTGTLEKGLSSGAEQCPEFIDSLKGTFAPGLR